MQPTRPSAGSGLQPCAQEAEARWAAGLEAAQTAEQTLRLEARWAAEAERIASRLAVAREEASLRGALVASLEPSVQLARSGRDPARRAAQARSAELREAEATSVRAFGLGVAWGLLEGQTARAAALDAARVLDVALRAGCADRSAGCAKSHMMCIISGDGETGAWIPATWTPMPMAGVAAR